MAEEKHVHRLPPCPDYDMVGVESWLTDLAKEGLLLDKDTQFFGFFSFTRTAPRTVKYRLEPAIKFQSAWDGDPGIPKEEALSLYAELGWEYVTRYGDFQIYRSYDPHARELHTDNEIQAEALNVIKKRQRSNLFWLLIHLLIQYRLGFGRYPLSVILEVGLIPLSILVAACLLLLIRPLVAWCRLRRMRKKLLSGEPIHTYVDWRSGALRRRILGHVPDLVLLFGLIGLLVAGIAAEEKEVRLDLLCGEPPFVTIADLNPGGEYEMHGLNYANRARQWESWPFIDNWDWYEFASIQLDDGNTLSGPLDIKYHEAISPALAELLAKDFIRYADQGKYFTEAVPLETGHEDVKAYRYLGKYGLNTVLITYENIVVEATILVDDADGNDATDLWIKLMAERLIAQ